MKITDEMVNAADSVLSRRRPGIPDETIRMAIAAALALQTQQGVEVKRYRHKKRGSEYDLLGIGKMQAENWFEDDAGWEPVDMREVAIYRSLDDGSLWVRPREEFEDGRFEPLRSALVDVPAVESEPVAWRYRHVSTVSWSYSDTPHPRPDLQQEPLYVSSRAVVKPLEEPVAYLRLESRTDIDGDTFTGLQMSDVSDERAFPVYAHPPRSLSNEGSEIDRALEFVARWAWREDPPAAARNLSDRERLSAIKHHPTIKARAALSTRKGSSEGDGSATITKGCAE